MRAQKIFTETSVIPVAILNFLNIEIGEYFRGIRPSAVSLGSRRVKEQMKSDKRFRKD